MGAHINERGEFQSDKYPTCPAGKVPLSTKDPAAQDLLWEYAQRRRAVDAEFATDLEAALLAKDFDPFDALLDRAALRLRVAALEAAAKSAAFCLLEHTDFDGVKAREILTTVLGGETGGGQ